MYIYVMFRLFSRHSLRFVGRLLLVVMLFAQAALASQPCMAPVRGPLSALKAASRPDAMPCPGHMHEGMAPATDSAQAPAPALTQPDMAVNLCVAHCTAGDQSADTPQVTIHAMPALPVLELSLALSVLPAERDSGDGRPRAVGDPPIPILFQVFRS